MHHANKQVYPSTISCISIILSTHPPAISGEGLFQILDYLLGWPVARFSKRLYLHTAFINGCNRLLNALRDLIVKNTQCFAGVYQAILDFAALPNPYFIKSNCIELSIVEY